MLKPPFGVESLPKTISDLRATSFELPRLAPDRPCRVFGGMRDFRHYVGVESAQQSDQSLRFLRTADIEEVRYWLWELDDDGTLAYAYVESYRGSIMRGTHTAKDLTPEQFLVMTYLRNQYQTVVR